MLKKTSKILLSIPVIFSLSLNAATLTSVVQETLNDNPNIQRYLSDYKVVSQELDASYSGYKPKLDLRAGVGYEQTKREGDGIALIENDLMRQEAEAVLSQNIFEGFNTQSDIEEKESRVNGSKYLALQEANVLALRTSEVYLEVLYQKQLLKLLDKNVKTHERIYKMIRQKTESGLGRRSDVEQTEGRLALAYSNYITQLNNYQDAMINFERVYGQSLAGSDLEIPTLPALPAASLSELESLATEYSPTLLLESANIDASKASYEKSKSNYYPRIDAELSGQWNENVSGLEGENNSYKGMLRASYNLYNGGSDESLRLSALQKITSFKESYNEQERAVFEKLKLAFLSEEIVRYKIRCLELHAELSKKTAESYSKEFQLGRRNLLDLLNVELEHNSAQQEVIAAFNNQRLARYRIYEALGLLPYILDSEITSELNIEEPEDVNQEVTELKSLTLKGELDQFIDLNAICTRVYEPIAQEVPEPEEVMEEPEVEESEPVIAAVVAKDISALMEAEGNDKHVVMDSVFFEYKSIELAPQAKEHLVFVADYLKSQPHMELIIYGHSDSIGSQNYNKDLSLRRAKSVEKEMIKLGIDTNHIKSIGMGEVQPIADNTTAEGREKNRRIEFELKPLVINQTIEVKKSTQEKQEEAKKDEDALLSDNISDTQLDEESRQLELELEAFELNDNTSPN
jgi:outer membrane protein, adhesin transport system